jgi:GT2 family glycosyltransferase
MLNRCVKSLLQHEPTAGSDIWIFDDGSPFFDEEIIFHKRIIRREVNKGYSTTINQALKYARDYRYDAVVTINSDVELLRPFINRAHQVFNFDKQIAVIGGMLLYPNGRIQSAGIGLHDNGAPIEYNKNELFTQDIGGEVSQPKYVMGVTGAFQIIRVSALEKIGFYDEGFQMSYEDVEFCWRTWRNKFRCFYDPHIKAVHAESATRGYHVGERELSSLNHWLKQCFKKTQHAKLLKLVEDANSQVQSTISSRHYAQKLNLVKPLDHSKSSS